MQRALRGWSARSLPLLGEEGTRREYFNMGRRGPAWVHGQIVRHKCNRYMPSMVHVKTHQCEDKASARPWNVQVNEGIWI